MRKKWQMLLLTCMLAISPSVTPAMETLEEITENEIADGSETIDLEGDRDCVETPMLEETAYTTDLAEPEILPSANEDSDELEDVLELSEEDLLITDEWVETENQDDAGEETKEETEEVWTFEETEQTLELASGDIIASGEKDTMSWILDSEGNLNITGSGTVTSAWSSYKESIKTVTIEGEFTAIGSYAFYNCKNLTTITIPEGITEIGNFAFCSCNINEITIPNSVTKIGSDAFLGCEMTELTVPEYVTEIGSGAFKGCTKLERITLPFIGGSSFSITNHYTDLFGYIFGATSYSGQVSGYYYDGGKSYRYSVPSSLKSVTITKSIRIPKDAFFDCSDIEEITLPAGVTVWFKWE